MISVDRNSSAKYLASYMENRCLMNNDNNADRFRCHNNILYVSNARGEREQTNRERIRRCSPYYIYLKTNNVILYSTADFAREFRFFFPPNNRYVRYRILLYTLYVYCVRAVCACVWANTRLLLYTT